MITIQQGDIRAWPTAFHTGTHISSLHSSSSMHELEYDELNRISNIDILYWQYNIASIAESASNILMIVTWIY